MATHSLPKSPKPMVEDKSRNVFLSSTVSRPSANRPRLCYLVRNLCKSEKFGFDIRYEPGLGAFITLVGAGGIGEQAGLETGQRIVGVNAVLVYRETAQKEIRKLMNEDPHSVFLLVASSEVDKHYTENKMAYSFDVVEERPLHSAVPSQNPDCSRTTVVFL